MTIIAAAAFALLGLGLAATLVLFLALRRDLRLHIQKQRTQFAEMQAALQVRAVERSRESIPMQTQTFSIPYARPAMNINKRTHAARLVRRGEDAAHIAAALAIPRCEAELLVRVHHLTARDSHRRTDASAE